MKKIMICLGLLAVAGISSPAYAATDAIKVDVMDEHHARPLVEGLIDAEALDLELEAARPGRPGDWLPAPSPRRPGWRGPRGPRFPEHRMTTCFARNDHGVTFRASGRDSSQMIQREAMRNCERSSWDRFSCRPLGCHR